jgi:hypothetical protein
MRRLRTAKRVTVALFLAGSAVATAAACRVFELGDVVPIAGDGDGGGASDAACVPDGDPCACLPAPFVVSPPQPGTGYALALAGTDVYLLAARSRPGMPAVYRAPLTGTGGAPPVQVTLDSTIPTNNTMMVVAGPWLFLRRTEATAGILRVPLDASNATPSVYVPLPSSDPNDLATDGARVYWTNTAGAVCAAPIDGAPAADAGPSKCSATVVVAARDGGPAAARVAVSATTVFLTYNAHVFAAPLATGVLNPTAVANIMGYSMNGVTEEGGRLFWAAGSPDGDGGGLASAKDDGDGGSKLVVAAAFAGQAPQEVFAVDADGLYWAATPYSQLWASAHDGSGAHRIACNTANVTDMVTDAAHVYWITNDGAVMRAEKR